MIDLISREKLEYVARRVLNYPLHDAEKDYFLTVVMKQISESVLSKQLVFKGGTAIYHCYLNQLRFSEDLDFTSLKKDISLANIKAIFEDNPVFEVKKEFESKATLKIERLKYSGVLDVPNSIKLETDRLQNVVLPSKKVLYNNVWGLKFTVNVMDPVEICAEKIRACNDRFRYRDFYDLYMIVDQLKIDTKAIKSLIPKKEIRKPISQENIERHLKLALDEVSEKGDTVMYRENIEPGKLVKFIKSLRIQRLEANSQH